MKFLAGLLLSLLIAASAGASGAAAGPHWDGHDQATMADCEHCTSEQMQAGADRCGSICASPAIGLPGLQEVRPVSEPATRLPEQRGVVAGQTRRPDPNPPRIS